MITYYLPDFYYFYSINMCLVDLLSQHPEFFAHDIRIGAIYGCFPNQIWNGGRRVIGQDVGINEIKNIIKSFNDIGIPIRFTYTNALLTEEHLDDVQCNLITEIANNGMNEILVNSPLLEDYLRNKFPNFKYILSTTKCIRDIDELNKLIKSNKYYLVLTDQRDNFDFDFLNKIEDKSKVEILINTYCSKDCPKRLEHYKIMSAKQLGLSNEIVDCPFVERNFAEMVESDDIIKIENLQKYIDMGFIHYKIEGRNFHFINVIDSYIYYLIKPEYQNKVRENILRVACR